MWLWWCDVVSSCVDAANDGQKTSMGSLPVCRAKKWSWQTAKALQGKELVGQFATLPPREGLCVNSRQFRTRRMDGKGIEKMENKGTAETRHERLSMPLNIREILKGGHPARLIFAEFQQAR
jgi:hypothetical protein